MGRILLVEDDNALASMLQEHLSRRSHVVEHTGEASDALSRLRFYTYDLLIIDWDLPDIPGPELIAEHRKDGGLTPVLMLTGKGDINDKIAGFNCGADDY